MSVVAHQVQVDEGVSRAEGEGNENCVAGNAHVFEEFPDGLGAHEVVVLGFGCGGEAAALVVVRDAEVEELGGGVALEDFARLFWG